MDYTLGKRFDLEELPESPELDPRNTFIKLAVSGLTYDDGRVAFQFHVSYLLQDHLLFEEDIIDAGDDYAITFVFDFRRSLALPGAPFAFFVHAGFFSHVSNTLVIQLSG